MRVAIVHSFYSSKSPSGENVAVEQQADALRDHGVEVKIVAARTDAEQERLGYHVRSAVTVSTGYGPSPLAEIEAFAPDLVHVHNLFPNWSTHWLDSWDGALVATVHNFRPLCAAGTLFRDGAVCTQCPDESSINAVRNACYRDSRIASIPLAIRTRKGVARDPLLGRADRIIALTDRSREIYSRYGIDPHKIDLIPNFVQDIGFHPDVPPGASWVYIGRLSEEKGILNLVKHWPAGEALSIYGEGPLKSEILAAAGPAVVYHGAVERAEVPRILSAARGLVFPSEWFEGGVPLVYVEALAAGRAVLAKSGSSAADDVIASGSGQVFGEWKDLADALDSLKSSVESCGASGRLHFEGAFTRNSWINKLLRTYETAIYSAKEHSA